MRPRARLASATVTSAVALLGLTAAAAASTVDCKTRPGQICSGASGPLKASIVPSTHQPKVDASWPLKVSATLAGKPAHANAIYEFLFGGSVVSTQYPRSNKHSALAFTGSFADTLVFPAESEGEPLTLRVVVSDSGHTVSLDWSIMSVK
jgi:hypothetical protein